MLERMNDRFFRFLKEEAVSFLLTKREDLLFLRDFEVLLLLVTQHFETISVPQMFYQNTSKAHAQETRAVNQKAFLSHDQRMKVESIVETCRNAQSPPHKDDP